MRFGFLLITVGLFCSAGCGKKTAEVAVEDPFSMELRCAACAHEFSLGQSELKKMKKSGEAIIPDGGLLQVKCPECNEIKAKDADPRLWPQVPEKRRR